MFEKILKSNEKFRIKTRPEIWHRHVYDKVYDK